MSNATPIDGMFGGIGRALSSRSYRIYWVGQVFHVQGIWVLRIAGGWLIFEMTNSAVWLGAIGFALSAPMLVLAPFAGAASDRIGHRKLASFAVFWGVPVLFLTMALTWAGMMTPVLLFILLTLQACLIALEYPARQALIPALIEPKHLTEAMGLNWATFNTAAFTGPLIAGLLITLGGAKLGFAAALFTYTAMLFALFRLRHLPTPASRRFNLASLASDVMDGVRYIRNHDQLPLLMAMYGFSSLLLRPYVDLMPGIAAQVFNQDASGLATLLAASGAGALSMAALMTYFAGRFALVPTFIWGAAGTAVFLLGFSQVSSLVLATGLLFAVGGLLTAFAVAATTLVQSTVDNAYRGRVIAITLALYIGTPAIGAFALGWLAESLGFQSAIATGAGLALIIVIVLFRRALRLPVTQPAK